MICKSDVSYHIFAGCEPYLIARLHMSADGELWAIDALARELPDVWFVSKPGTDGEARAASWRKSNYKSHRRPKTRVASEDMSAYRDEGFPSSHIPSEDHATAHKAHPWRTPVPWICSWHC